jgi:hypothetical protein
MFTSCHFRKPLRKSFGLCLLLAACALQLTPEAGAEVPSLIRYQGQAMDSQGAPLNGPYDLTFRLYDAEVGGAPVWQELHQAVQISDGHFSVLLGNGTPAPSPLDGVDWSLPCWLSVQVNAEPELAPRQRITSVPLALRARSAEVVKTSGLTDDANSLVPQGAVILWTGTTCPAGYSRVTTMDNKFLVSGGTFNPAAGGSNTHNHGGNTGSHALTIAEMPAHTHDLIGTPFGGGNPAPRTMYNDTSEGGSEYSWKGDTGNTTANGKPYAGSTGGNQGHVHAIGAADNRPEYATILLCQKD